VIGVYSAKRINFPPQPVIVSINPESVTISKLLRVTVSETPKKTYFASVFESFAGEVERLLRLYGYQYPCRNPPGKLRELNFSVFGID